MLIVLWVRLITSIYRLLCNSVQPLMIRCWPSGGVDDIVNESLHFAEHTSWQGRWACLRCRQGSRLRHLWYLSYYNIDEQCLTVDNLVCLSSRYFSRVTMLVIMAVFLKIFIKVLLKLFDHTLSAWQIFFKSEAEWWGGGGADSGRGGRGLTYDAKWLFYICNICNIWNICHVHLSTTI